MQVHPELVSERYTTTRIPAHIIHKREDWNCQCQIANVIVDRSVVSEKQAPRFQPTLAPSNLHELNNNMSCSVQAQGTHAAPAVLRKFYSIIVQFDRSARHAAWSPVATEYAAFNSVSPSASHILMLVAHHSSVIRGFQLGASSLLTMWEHWMHTWCWSVGDSKSSHHMLPQMKTGDPSQHSHPLSVHFIFLWLFTPLYLISPIIF